MKTEPSRLIPRKFTENLDCRKILPEQLVACWNYYHQPAKRPVALAKNQSAVKKNWRALWHFSDNNNFINVIASAKPQEAKVKNNNKTVTLAKVKLHKSNCDLYIVFKVKTIVGQISWRIIFYH